jgi:hypothetical protein
VGIRGDNGSVNEREREKFWGQAIRNLRIAWDRVTRRYNEARREPRFRIGDTVVYRRHVLSSREKGISQKFELRWSRPMVIVKYLAPNVVLLAL